MSMMLDSQGNLVPAPPAPPAPPGQPGLGAPPQRFYTEDELNAERERIRKEEKDKLYPDLEAARNKAAQLEAEKAERQRVFDEEQARLQAEADTQRRAAEAEELSAKDLIERRIAEERSSWEAGQADLRRQIEERDIIIAKEREFAQLQIYTSQVVAANADKILPELVELIGGNSPEEVDRSVEAMVNRTASIMGNVQASQAESARQIPTASANSPSVSWHQPVERTYSNEDIKNMNMDEWAKNRTKFVPNNPDRGLY